MRGTAGAQQTYLKHSHRKPLKDVDGNSHAGMARVIHIVTAIIVNDVNVVRVIPNCWPWINESKRITAVVETPMIVVASIDVKDVSTTKTGAIVLVRNSAMTAVTSRFIITL